MFTDKIQELVDKKGITVAKMLRDLDLANSIFSKWKNRGSVPNFETVKKIADYFQVSVDCLLEKEKTPVEKTEAERLFNLYELADERTRQAVDLLLNK